MLLSKRQSIIQPSSSVRGSSWLHYSVEEEDGVDGWMDSRLTCDGDDDDDDDDDDGDMVDLMID